MCYLKITFLTPFKQLGDVLWDDPIITYKMLLTYQLNYAINVIKTGIEIVDKCSFIDYISFKNYAENYPSKHLDTEAQLYQ